MWTARVLLTVLAAMCALAYLAPEATRGLGLAGLSQYTTNPFTPHIGMIAALGVIWLATPALNNPSSLRIFWVVYGLVAMALLFAVSAGGGLLMALAAGAAGRHGKSLKVAAQAPGAVAPN